MKAAVTLNKETVIVKEVQKPVPQDDEVLIHVLTAGICGGDVRVYNGTFPYLNYPIINGHEFCGIVEEIGKNVTHVTVGDYVTAEPIIPCGHCYPCSIGKSNCCSALKVLGIHVDGCFGEYICVRDNRVYQLPDSIDPLDACLVEPYGVGMHAIDRMSLTAQDSLFIIGAGPIGMCALDIAKSMGVRVMISDMLDNRLELAKKLCADRVVNPSKCDIMQEVLDFTGGQKFPAVLEATGVPPVMQSTQDYVAHGGRICLAGVTDKTFEFSTMTFCNKEVSVFGTRNSLNVFPRLIKMMEEKKLHPEVIRTDVFDLDCFENAIKKAAHNTADVCKIVLKVGEK